MRDGRLKWLAWMAALTAAVVGLGYWWSGSQPKLVGWLVIPLLAVAVVAYSVHSGKGSIAKFFRDVSNDGDPKDTTPLSPRTKGLVASYATIALIAIIALIVIASGGGAVSPYTSLLAFPAAFGGFVVLEKHSLNRLTLLAVAVGAVVYVVYPSQDGDLMVRDLRHTGLHLERAELAAAAPFALVYIALLGVSWGFNLDRLDAKLSARRG